MGSTAFISPRVAYLSKVYRGVTLRFVLDNTIPILSDFSAEVTGGGFDDFLEVRLVTPIDGFPPRSTIFVNVENIALVG